jgi:hypothetical protein
MNPAPDLRHPPWPLVLSFALCGALAGTLLGGASNAINAPLQPEAYQVPAEYRAVNGGPLIVIQRPDVTDEFSRGAVVGVIFGLFFGVVLASGVGCLTGCCCSFGFAVRHFLMAVVGVVVWWIIGGLAALGFLVLDPTTCRNTFGPQTPLYDARALMGHAWAGGSTWGATVGSVLSVIVVLDFLRHRRGRSSRTDPRSPSGGDAHEGSTRALPHPSTIALEINGAEAMVPPPQVGRSR